MCRRPSNAQAVMAARVAAIHDLLDETRAVPDIKSKTWMPGTSPGMTAEGCRQ